jgi:mannosyl-oligosaccharide alpha-1,2-mannosidase
MYSQSLGLAAVLALAAQTVVGVPAHAPKYDTNSKLSNERAAGVKEAFQFAWDGYYKYAFPHDELHPISNSYSDSRSVPPETPKTPLELTFSRNGWGASAVDAFTTAIVMENKEVTNTILDFIGTINFGAPVAGSQISLFETTIRYLGGMLSGN